MTNNIFGSIASRKCEASRPIAAQVKFNLLLLQKERHTKRQTPYSEKLMLQVRKITSKT